MQWLGRRQSSNVDDRRGISGGQVAAGGGVLAIIYFIAQFLLGGGDVSDLQSLPQAGQQQEMTTEETAADEKRAAFVKVVFADTEDVWDKIFADNGKQYQKPTLVLFRNATQSACGTARSATGPFYCPADNDVYIDLSFAQDLESRFNVAGEFALAYVVAHEVGHHVQYLQGTSDKMNRLRQQSGEAEYNKYSVMLELQADFYAGVWAHFNQKMKNVIKENDIEEALVAANAIGDDRLQKEATGEVMPDSFTHGTSAQRMYWFKKGYETGDLSQGNTFENSELR